MPENALLSRLRRPVSACATLLVLSLGFASAETAADRLRSAVLRVVDEADGQIGVAIKHFETGQQIEVNGSVRFPMASTFKLGVLVELFRQVDDGKIRLDDMVDIKEGDLHLGSGQLSDYRAPGISLSVENLALLMMRISDNSATDKLMSIVGIENINRTLEELGITGMSVDRTCQRLILDWLGMEPEKTSGMSYREIEVFLNAYQPAEGELESAQARFDEDPRDTATPLAMNALLESVFTARAASMESSARMMDILLECDTGRDRIRGMLPASTRVAHKTGTLGGTVNNVGILFLPDGRGHVAVSVLSKEMEDRTAAARAIADIARSAYDFFLFASDESSGTSP